MTARDPADFFVSGGTLRLDAPSYVRRPADDELFQRALAGEFCYVLTPRQMGKSSLMVRTATRLQAHGVHTVIVDLTSIGAEVSAEQWYLGLLTRIKARLLRPRRELIDLPALPAWWEARAHLGTANRFTDFLREVVLEQVEGQIVIFVDEIDTTLKLDFTDDFFAAIRAMYNARASDPAFQRLTFVLLGVATPADLIKDRSRTPFNVGQGIALREFSRADAGVLQAGLEAACPGHGEALLARIDHWTGGHPYLTQKLCRAVAESGCQDVDALVESHFLSETAHKEVNLQFVRDGILNSPHRRALLALYRDVYAGRAVPDDERSLHKNQLKLLGLVKSEDGVLRVRNAIYRHVFDRAWIREHLTTDWVRYAWIPSTLVALLLVAAIALNLAGRVIDVARLSRSLDLDGDGQPDRAWLVLRRAGEPGAEEKLLERPYHATVYYGPLLRLPAQPLAVKENRELCRCTCDVLETDLVSREAGAELVLDDRCQGRTTGLSIFHWDESAGRYQGEALFYGSEGIDYGLDTVTLASALPEHPRLVQRVRYAPAGRKTDGTETGAEIAEWAWSIESTRVTFASGVPELGPEDVLTGDDPFEMPVSFYRQYTDTAALEAYVTPEAWARLEGCAQGRCGCPIPPGEVAEIWVREVQEPAPAQADAADAPADQRVIEVWVSCESTGGAVEHTTTRWTLAREAGRWQAVAIEATSQVAELYLSMGNSAAAQGEYEQAIRHYDRALAADPEMAGAHLQRGNAHRATGDAEAALQDYTAALALSPELVEAYAQRGDLHLELGQYERAIQDLTRVIALNPDAVAAYYNRGLAYVQRGEYAQAVADFTEALRLNPAYTRAYFERAHAHYEQQNYEAAIADLTELIRRDAALETAYYNRGLAYFYSERYTLAVADFDEALRLNPAYTEALLRRGLAHAELDQRTEASADLRQVLETSENAAWREQAREALAALGEE